MAQESLTPNYSAFSNEVVDFMEQCTGYPAEQMVHLAGVLDAPDSADAVGGGKGFNVLDNACGGGVASSHLFRLIPESHKPLVKVVAGDLEPAMIEKAVARAKREGWTNVNGKVVDAQAMPFEDNTFTHILTNFGIQLFPDPMKAVTEMHRVLCTGGILSYTAWTQPGWNASLQTAIPGTWPTPEVFQTPWTVESRITEQLTDVGFTEIKVTPLTHEMRLRDRTVYQEQVQGAMPNIFTPEVMEKVLAVLKEEFGEGDIVLTWESLVVTAKKV